MISFTVFYSWQSDLPNDTNRKFIEKSLQIAINKVVEKISGKLQLEIKLDQATQDVSGARIISEEIIKKVDECHIFLGDVSLIGKVREKYVPNPNVLVELGYGAKSVGYENCILVFNEKYGKVKDSPFDYVNRRILLYECEVNDDTNKKIKELSEKIEHEIINIIMVYLTKDSLPKVKELESLKKIVSELERFTEKLSNEDADRANLIHKEMGEILEEAQRTESLEKKLHLRRKGKELLEELKLIKETASKKLKCSGKELTEVYKALDKNFNKERILNEEKEKKNRI